MTAKPTIIFDIDGTLLNSVEIDDAAFIQTYQNLYNIDLGKADWTTFPHVTDWGLTNTIFEQHFHRLPSDEELARIKAHFLHLIREKTMQYPSKMTEIPGAIAFVNRLKKEAYSIGIATGGWEETARFKLNHIGLNIDGIAFANSNHHYIRKVITEYAIQLVHGTQNIDNQSIIYFGDGKWDLLTCREMKINFVGVDYFDNGKLKALGAANVIQNYDDLLHSSLDFLY